MKWPWQGKTYTSQATVPEPIPARPEPDVYEVTLEHYLIKTLQGAEYQVWADTIRYDTGVGRTMTTFLETKSYTWVLPSGWCGSGSQLLEWKRSASYQVLLEIRSSYVLSIELIGSKVKEVECR